MTARALLSLFALAAASLVLAAASDATTPGVNGRIVYVGPDGLYSAAADGSDGLPLWTDGSLPAWSPDGTRIAFLRLGGDGRSKVWLMNADGSGQRQLTPDDPAGSADALRLTWSPDGSTLAFTSTRGGGCCRIWMINADGTNLHQWNGPEGVNPTWSPDGTRIVFQGSGGLLVANADGSAAEQLTTFPAGSYGGSPAWSPDGSSIAFERDDGTTGASDLYTVGADGTGLRQLTTLGSAHDPAWSPDATKIVFENGSGSSTNLYEVNADGGNLTYLIRVPGTVLPVIGEIPSWGSSTVRPLIDTTPPSIELHTPADGAIYELGATVSADYACSDELSGIARCGGPVANGAPLDTSRTGSSSFQVTATDRAGHLSTTTVTYTVADRTAPTLTLTAPTDGGVYDMGSRVNVDYACSDLSGIATCSGTLPRGASLDTSRAGTYTFTATATDNSGNLTSKSATYTVADRTRPTITITTPTDGAAYLLGATTAADYSCADEPGGSGLHTCNAAPLDTTSIGSKTFTVTASDNTGNAATASRSYSIIYAFDGFYSPTAAYPTATSANAGQSVKVRFSLHGDHGLDVLAPGSPTWMPCHGGTAMVSAGTLSYQAALDRYVYEASTPKSWAGACRDLVITLRDGTVHKARLQFDK